MHYEHNFTLNYSGFLENIAGFKPKHSEFSQTGFHKLCALKFLKI